MNTKVIVTGGAGFIGGHIVDLLVDNHYDVHVIDNISTSDRHKYVNSSATYYNRDIKNIYEIKDIFKNTKYVFHLAAYARVIPSIEDPVTFHEENINGSLNVFMSAKNVGAKVIFSSSSSIYGEPRYLPIDEEHPKNPMCPYALHKLVGEQYLELFSKIYGLNSISLRYFNVFGERAPNHGPYVPVIGIFLKQKKDGKKLTIVGDGNQRRDFIHVKDVARANLMAALYNSVGADYFNVGSGESTSVIDIAKYISNNTINIPYRFEYRNAISSISKIQKILGWTPTINLYEWIDSQL